MHVEAAACALVHGCTQLYWGVNATDLRSRPEEERDLGSYRETFARLVELTSRGRHAIEMVTPFEFIQKAELITWALTLGFDIDKLVSCSSGGEEPCGHCNQCVAREQAEREAEGMRFSVLDYNFAPVVQMR